MCTLFRLIGQKNFEKAKRMGTITNDRVWSIFVIFYIMFLTRSYFFS